MTTIRYITIREFSEFHNIEVEVVKKFIAEGLVAAHQQDEMPCIDERDIEQLESMIRLHHELEINIAGVETIMHMRRRMAEMQSQLAEMEYRLHKYDQLLEKLFRPKFS